MDQGEADEFLAEQLRPELLAEACAAADHPLTLRMQPGHDHSYYFIATFLADHFAFYFGREGDHLLISCSKTLLNFVASCLT